MQSVSPVLTEAEVEAECVIALDQEEFYPIIIARVKHSNGINASYTRFRLSDEERKLIAEGADIILGQPHHGPMMPISIDIAWPFKIPKEWL